VSSSSGRAFIPKGGGLMPDPTTRTSLCALAVVANLQAVLACQAERRSESHRDRFGAEDRVGGERVTHHPAPLADGVDHWSTTMPLG
jgi:hypothetical protein